MIGGHAASKFDESTWDGKEHDWTDRSFFFVPMLNIFHVPIRPARKLDALNKGLREGGYKTLNQMVLLEYTPFKGKMMVAVEKQDKMDANIMTYDIEATVSTVVYKSDSSGLGKAVKNLKEMVVSRKGHEPRAMYYLYIPSRSPGGYKTVIFAVT